MGENFLGSKGNEEDAKIHLGSQAHVQGPKTPEDPFVKQAVDKVMKARGWNREEAERWVVGQMRQGTKRETGEN